MSTQITESFVSAASRAEKIADVVADITRRIDPKTTVLLNVFFSSRYPAQEMAAALQAAYPETHVIGCTTAGELSNEGFTEQAVSAFGFMKGGVSRLAVAVAENCNQNAAPISAALKKIAGELNVDLNRLAPDRYLGIVLTDGNSGHEEFVMDTLAAEAFNLTFVGGSAGDDLQFKQAFVLADGKAYSNSAVLALIETARPFTIVKTQSFRTTGRIWEVTKADPKNRIVYELDGKPAAQAYAEALSIPKEQIGDRFMSNPIGLLVGSVPFVRSPQRLEGDAIRFYCQVNEGSRVHLLESGDMVTDTRADLEKARQGLGALSGMLVFNCILRYLDAKNRNIVDQLGKTYDLAPAAGFNTYGEQYLGHINQTATVVCFS